MLSARAPYAVAPRQDAYGQWVVVELGDGQVAGLPETADLNQFYQALEAGSQHPRRILHISARIRLYDTSEGGLKDPLREYLRCPMKIDGKDDAYHDCNVSFVGRTVHPGETFDATVEFLCPELVALWLKPGRRFWLWSLRTIGEGETIDVCVADAR